MDQQIEEPHYVIVDFPEESSNGQIAMALISSTWIHKENDIQICSWPAYLKSTVSREKAIRNHTNLDYNKTWKCPISILYRLRDYDIAKAKLQRLEDCGSSSLSDSSFLSPVASSRKPKAKIDSNYNYDFDDDDFEQGLVEKVPPLKKDQNKNISKTCTITDVFSGNMHQNVSEHFTIFVDKDKTFTNLRNVSPVEQVMPTKNLVAESVSNQSNDNQPSVVPQCNCDSAKIFKLLSRLLRDVQEIKSEMKKMNATAQVQNSTEFNNLEKELSLLTYEALIDFNNKLMDMKYFHKMQSTLALLGGRDTSECTRKILSAIMGPDLSLKINWIGANSKGSFQKLDNLLNLIYGTVRRNSACSSSTNYEIDSIIKSWLKNAADREGGRNHRRKCKPPQVD